MIFSIRFSIEGFVKKVLFLNSFRTPDRSYFFLNLLRALSIFSFSATAGETLSGDQIKSLFDNKTFEIHNLEKGKKLQGYAASDGSFMVYIPWKDKTSKRKWWVEGDKHCTSHPKRGDTCKVIKKHAEGEYHGYVNGTHTRTLTNFRDGNQL